MTGQIVLLVLMLLTDYTEGVSKHKQVALCVMVSEAMKFPGMSDMIIVTKVRFETMGNGRSLGHNTLVFAGKLCLKLYISHQDAVRCHMSTYNREWFESGDIAVLKLSARLPVSSLKGNLCSILTSTLYISLGRLTTLIQLQA